MGTGLGQDAFLKMFMAQVTHQNPLDPMDNTEFTAQLATFSQLEQLTKIAKGVDGLGSLKDAMAANTAVSSLGKEVTLSGDVLPVAGGHVGEATYNLESDADVYIVISDATGAVVSEENVGRRAAGFQKFQWDGKTLSGSDAPDGAYKITIRAATADGAAVKVTDQTVSGLVTGYRKDEDGSLLLLLGEAALRMKDVLAVREPAGTAQTQAMSGKGSDDGWSVGDVLK